MSQRIEVKELTKAFDGRTIVDNLNSREEGGLEDITMKMNQEHKCFNEKESSRLYRIGMFAAMNHITIKTLRFYEEQGLLTPAFVDEENGYRYFTMDQMAVIHQISALKEIGFTLEDMKQINSQANESAFLVKKKIKIMEEIAALTTKLTKLESYINDANFSLNTPVLIKTIPAAICATMENRIESYDALFDAMPAMGAEMERLGCECALPEYCFTHYLEPGYKDENIPIETCEAVTQKGKESDLVKFKEFPEIEAACIYHKGSYIDFPKTYRVILKYIEDNHYEICGNIRENYIDGVWNKELEKEWLSEIQIPVRKKEGEN